MTRAARWLFGITAAAAALFVHLLPAPSERQGPAATAVRLTHGVPTPPGRPPVTAAEPEGRVTASAAAPAPTAEGQVAPWASPAPPSPPGAPAVFSGSTPGPILPVGAPPVDGRAAPGRHPGSPAQADAAAVR